MRRNHRWAGLLVTGLVILCSCAQANAQGFYSGKTVTLIVPHQPGRGFDTYARRIVPFMERHLAARIVVNNVVGAGGIVGANRVWHSRPDGLTIGFTSLPILLLADLAGSEGVQFKATRFTYLGRVSTEPRVIAVRPSGAIQSVSDLASLQRPFVFPVSGPNEDFLIMAVVANSLGVRLRAVTGFQGQADEFLAVIRGDGDAAIATVSTLEPLFRQGDLRPLLVVGSERLPEYPETPTVLEITSGPERATLEAIVNMLEIYRVFFGPPDMNSEATGAMRAAIRAALAEPELQQWAATVGRPLDFMDGSLVQEKAAASEAAGESVVPILRRALEAIR